MLNHRPVRALLAPLVLAILPAVVAGLPCSGAQDGGPPAAAPGTEPWRAAEAAHLANHTQLTFGDRFVKAGEAYFSPDGKQVIFQAVEQPAPGAAADDFYGMYLADLIQSTGSQPTLGSIRRISPKGSANTCGWFDASKPGSIIFASTITAPTKGDAPGYQRGTGRYRWAFPPEMRVVRVNAADADGTDKAFEAIVGDGKGYVAECSTSPDGRWLIYCTLETGDGNIHVKDLRSGADLAAIPLVVAPGYDGGPFFSPDGKRICFRSDRQGNDLLQVFVADLDFAADGRIQGIRNERNIAPSEHVNWGPYWHPDGKRIVYATSQMGHQNYEVFEVDVPDSPETPLATPRRITFAESADVLPAFDATGRKMMWTSKRGADRSSQMWIADFLTP